MARVEKTIISERLLLSNTVRCIYKLAPGHLPRKIEIIMTKLRDAFRKDAVLDGWGNYIVSVEDMYKYVDSILKSIDEFNELNLSYTEYKNGIGVEDESRGKYLFTSIYSSTKEENDFIDLDACVRNIANAIIIEMEPDDCFCCSNSNSDKCNECILNEKFRNHFIYKREPKFPYTFSCKYDCEKTFYICCEECTTNNGCEYKCKSKSSECGNSLFKIWDALPSPGELSVEDLHKLLDNDVKMEKEDLLEHPNINYTKGVSKYIYKHKDKIEFFNIPNTVVKLPYIIINTIDKNGSIVPINTISVEEYLKDEMKIIKK